MMMTLQAIRPAAAVTKTEAAADAAAKTR